MTHTLLCLTLLALVVSPSLAQNPPQTRGGDRKGYVIGLLMVPELLPGDCEPFAPATLPVFAVPGGAPIGELRGEGRPPAVTVCEFPEVRAVIGGASFDVATAEHGYEEPSLIVTATRGGWYQVATGGRPALVWMKPTARSVYRPLAALFTDSLTYLGPEWDRRLYTRPGGAFSVLAPPPGAGELFEPSVDVGEVTLFRGVYWARVTMVTSPCTPDEPAAQGSGWVRVHGPEAPARPILWFHSRGC